MTEDLSVWLLEQIAEDERIAREVASPSPWVVDDQQRDDRAIYGAARGATVAYDPAGDVDSKRDFAHIVRWEPARVLAECDSKRQIMEHAAEWFKTLHETPEGWTEQGATAYRMAMEWTLRQLALPYSDRPGYRTEWTP